VAPDPTAGTSKEPNHCPNPYPYGPPPQQPPEAELAAKERDWLDPEHGHHGYRHD
jgi:hypothetical protein